MKQWIIEFVDQEAEKEFFELEPSFQAKFIHITELIERFGPFKIGMPHIRSLEGKLWEIRMSGLTGIARSLFVVVRYKKVIILHTFVKKTQKTPKKALEKAKLKLRSMML
jgi:phage-related protein